MSLLDLARADLISITRNTSDFSRAVTMTSPALVSETIYCIGADIAFKLDVETDRFVGSRESHISVDMQQLIDAFGSLPNNTEDNTLKPWLVQTTDAVGVVHTFKIVDVNPDRELGIIGLQLGIYEP